MEHVQATTSGAFIYHSKHVDIDRTNALCISGSRIEYLLIPEVHAAIKRYVLDENNPDIFIYGYQLDSTVNATSFMELYGDYLSGFMLKRWTEDDTKALDAYDPLSTWKTQVSLFRSIRECHQTLLTPFSKYIRQKPYDVIMRARPDMLYRVPVRMANYETRLQPKMYFPPPHNYGSDPRITHDVDVKTATFQWKFFNTTFYGINDQCALGSPFVMDLYAMLLGHRITFKKFFFPETVVHDYFVNGLNVTVLLADFKYDLLRK